MDTLMDIAAPAATAKAGAGRLLAYVGDPDTEAAIRRATTNLLVPGVLVRKGDVRTATRDLARERSPDLLVVDLSGIDLPISAIEALAQSCEPSVKVVALGDRNDVGLYRELRALGVTEYLFKPVNADLLERVLARIWGQAPDVGDRTRRGKVVAVTGARGGTGSTTLAVNLAVHLADTERRRVALVDLDIQRGTVALQLNIRPGRGLREALDSPDRVDDLFLERSMLSVSERLDALASEEPLSEVTAPGPDALLALLAKLQEQYHYVVVDIPTSLDAAARATLGTAAIRILVADPSLSAARDAGRLATLLNPAGLGGQTLVVLNRRGEPGGLSPADFAKALGRTPDLAIDWRPKPVCAAATLGVPAIRTCAPYRHAVARLAREVSGQAPQDGGGLSALISRLKRR
jgi:pilus assembly protein CpaE